MKIIGWMLSYGRFPAVFWVPVLTMSYFTGIITAVISMKVSASGRVVLRFMAASSRGSLLLIFTFVTEKRIFGPIWIWRCLAWLWRKPLAAGATGSIRKPMAASRRCPGEC